MCVAASPASMSNSHVVKLLLLSVDRWSDVYIRGPYGSLRDAI